jgi:transcriptional regulator with XRE-family HTH domain
MNGHKILSYFKTYRLQSGLTQKDITFLLSLKNASSVSRTEKNLQKPSLKIVLAYSLIFDIEIEKLLPKAPIDINKLIINRASLLATSLQKRPQTPLTKQRIAFLESLLHRKKGTRR